MEASQPQDERTDEERAADEQAEAERQEAQDQATPGDQGEQVAHDAPGGAGPDTEARTSAPDPAAQSGVPLPEDREAGVEPGPVHPEPSQPDEESAESGE